MLRRSHVGSRPGLRSYITLVLFLMPVCYMGQLTATVIHEAIGHGLMTLLLGGKFSGFALYWDGMGYAWIELPEHSPVWQQVLSLAGGVTSTLACGAMCLLVAGLLRHRPYGHLAIIVLASTFVLEGLPYLFWNAYQPLPPGDIGRILGLLPNSTLRWVTMACSGAALVAVTVLLNRMLYQSIVAWLPRGAINPQARGQVPILLIVGLGGITWFPFDWDQLAPGLGLLPNFVGAGSQLACAALFYWFSPPIRQITASPPCRSASPLVITWSLFVIVLVTLAMLPSQGVHW